MNLVFSRSFKSDIKGIKDQKLKQKIKDVILLLETATALEEVKNVVKMKGHPRAYRIRIGEYRMGIYYEDKTIQIMRFLKRSDIYKVFPNRK